MLSELPIAFRAACHWVLFARAVVGPGLPSTEVPHGLPLKQRSELIRAAVAGNELRKVLFPDG